MKDLSDNFRGALLMTGAMTAFTVNDACMKLLSGHIPFFQLVFLRSLATVILLGAIAWRAGIFRKRISAADWRLVGIRTLAEVGAAWFFLTALFNMPIANVTAILQVMPLSVTLGAALFLREPVGWRRLTAIVVGFFGVMLIVKPGTEGFTIYSAYALLSVVCVTVRDLAVRRMSAAVPSLAVALAAASGVMLFAGAGAAVTDWAPMRAGDGLTLGLAVAGVLFGYLFSVSAMRVGDIGAVAPFRYVSVIAALVAGFVIFGEWPGPVTLVGVAIVVASGLFTLWRERQTSRARRSPALSR